MTKGTGNSDENDSIEPADPMERRMLEILRREVLIGWNQARNGQFSNQTVEEIAEAVAKSTKQPPATTEGKDARQMHISDGYTDVPPGKLATIVTSLEMDAPPQPRPVPTGSWALRRVQLPALDWYRDLYRRIGEDWLWFSRLAMPTDDLQKILHSPEIQIYALVADGRDEGLLELDFRAAGDCELAFFGVTPAHVGRGAGRFLMNHAIEIAWSRPIRRFWVHTCTLDHPSALDFYRRSGFTPFRAQVEVVDDPRLTGLLPRDTAPHVPLIDA